MAGEGGDEKRGRKGKYEKWKVKMHDICKRGKMKAISVSRRCRKNTLRGGASYKNKDFFKYR
jgi:hypothetical protein